MAFASYDNKSVDASLKRGEGFLEEWKRQRDGALQTLQEERRLAQSDLRQVEEVQSALNALPGFADNLTESDLESVRRGISQARSVIKTYLQESSDALESLKS